MTRRYGRVTFEGWLLDVVGDTYLNTMREGFNASETGVLYSGLKATVEYLPEPVVFNDGDVVRYLDDYADVLVRVDGAWRCNRIHIGTAPHTDDEITHSLTSGIAVRLIEATP